MFSAATKTAAQAGGYQISRSLRFNSADSAYLNRTPASAGNRKTMTFSFWTKRTAIDVNGAIFSSDSDSVTNIDLIRFKNSNDLRILLTLNTSGPVYGQYDTVAVFRDPSAWYHVVVAIDTTQATDTNRVKLYVNNVQQSFSGSPTYPSQNFDCLYFNNNISTFIGSYYSSSGHYSGLLTEINFIDGQALTPSSFGETNAQTGVWQPKAYSGSYGTNGFYVNFSDNSNTTSTTLGKDYSGNGNNWTPNNFSVAAGAGNDSLVDTPTPYGSDSGAGGEVRGNYCTLNPVFKVGAGTPSYDNGNLDMTAGGTGDSYFAGTTVLTEGKWYYEATITSVGNGILIGVCRVTDSQTIGNLGSYRNTSVIYNLDGTTQTAGATYTTNDVIGVAIDIDNGTVKFYKNNVGQGATNSFTFTAGTPLIVRGRSNSTTATVAFNFGQRPFAYTAPSGFKALCTQNLPTPTIGATTATQAGKYFNPVLYTGNGNTTAQAITGAGFQPDWVWIKARSAAYVNLLFDAVRGAGKQLISDLTNAESTVANFVSFDSDGFTVNASGGASSYNANGTTYVAWQWKANGAGSSNTAGSITSTVSANTTSGFSVVTWTGNSANATIGHGLGVAPSMVIIKYRGTTDAWYVYHASIGNNQYLVLNTTDAAATNTNIWQNTAPTSSVFSIGFTNNQSTIVAYCFAEIPGFSRISSYIGNGSADGPFVYTGFRPAYVMVKRTVTSGDGWPIQDATRFPNNVITDILGANSSSAESTFGSNFNVDFLSNGFKVRTTSTAYNANGDTYIFIAFATSPFKYSIAR